jgi:hypothetical protein
MRIGLSVRRSAAATIRLRLCARFKSATGKFGPLGLDISDRDC